MPANQFGRYVWLVDTLRRYGHLSYKEISEKWQQSGLSYGDGDTLPLRTFHNHRKAIFDIFKIIIEIDPDIKGYKYHIANPEELEGDSLRSWLVDSYATLNQVQADSRLRDRIEFENIPSGHIWLTTFLQAMRQNKVMKITHQGFGKDYANTFEIEPYCLKVVERRWYIIANNPYYVELNNEHKGDKDYTSCKEIRAYGLDRIKEAVILDRTFKIKEGFSMREFYDGCTGIIPSDGPIEHVVLKAYGNAPDYLRTLPLHESQQELGSDDESATFSYDVKLTYDFLQLIMQQGEQVEVLEPNRLRDQMHNLAKTLTHYYNAE
jgi:predicted DNA-binding transcriptional regulator YafY